MWAGLVLSDLVAGLPPSSAVIGAASLLYLLAFVPRRRWVEN
jgi:hypothetical protein